MFNVIVDTGYYNIVFKAVSLRHAYVILDTNFSGMTFQIVGVDDAYTDSGDEPKVRIPNRDALVDTSTFSEH